MDLRSLLVEIKTFLLGLSRLEDEQDGKRVQILGSLELWLYRLSSNGSNETKGASANSNSRFSTDTAITEKSYESIIDRNASYISTATYDEYQEGISSSESNDVASTNSAAAAVNPISGRRDTQSEQFPDPQNSQCLSDHSTKSADGLRSTYSTSNLTGTDQPPKHTGRLGPSLNPLRKAVSKTQTYYAALLSDRLVLSKSIRDMRPWQEIRLHSDSVCEQQGKLGIRITEPLVTGRMNTHSFSCQNSTEAHTWVDVINEVIRSLRNSPSAPPENCYMPFDESDRANSEECLSTLSLDGNATRQKSNSVVASLTKSVGRRWVRRFSKDAITHPSPELKIPLSESPHGPSPTADGGVGGELLVRAAYLNQSASGQSVSRHCRVANGLFSVFQKSDSSEPEFTFPLQCCELVPDPEATNEELKFRIVQGTLEKVSCEAFDQMSHFNWLKHLSKVISNVSRTVPDQLLESSLTGQSEDSSTKTRSDYVLASPRRRDGDEMPHDEYDDYQIPISLKRFNPGLRQALQSIRQSFTDEEAMSAEGSETHRSQQNLHHREGSTSATNVKRSRSTRPLYNLTERQNLQTKARRRLLPDIERCLDRTEERLQEGDTFDDYNGDNERVASPASPANPEVSQPHCESAIYVEATAIPAEHSSARSSASNYSSASAGRGSNYSSGVGSGGGRLLDEEEEKDDLLLPTSHYTRSPSRPVSHMVEESDENIYEDVQPILSHSPVTRTMTDGPAMPSHPRVPRKMADVPPTPSHPPVTRAMAGGSTTPSHPPVTRAMTDSAATPSHPPVTRTMTDSAATPSHPRMIRTMTDGAATLGHPPMTKTMTNGPPPKPPSTKPRRARTFNSNDVERPPSAFMRDLTAAVTAKAKAKTTAEVDAQPVLREESVEKGISSTQSSPSKKSTAKVDVEDVTVTSSPSDPDILTATKPPKLPPKPRKIQRSPYVEKKPSIQLQRDGKSTSVDDRAPPAVTGIKSDVHPIDAS